MCRGVCQCVDTCNYQVGEEAWEPYVGAAISLGWILVTPEWSDSWLLEGPGGPSQLLERSWGQVS